MSYKYIYDPVAFDEYKNAITWYLGKSESAATNFIKEIKKTIGIICKDPYRFRNTYKKFRETSLKKFPYSIVYYPDESNHMIVISSIFHHKRNPKRKFRKRK
jgi:plasmid stabilization system protein ParE